MMADDLEALARHQPRGHAADVAEALNDHAWWTPASMPKRSQRFERDDHAAAAGGFRCGRASRRVRSGLPVTTAVTVWRMCME